MTNYSLEDVEKELLERRAAARSLHEFVKQAWPQVEGGRPFVDGKHIQAICEHLEAVFRGEIKRLLINMPPRCCKSSILSVMLPAWWWIHKPEEQFLYVSYALNLSMDHSVKCRRVIESPWYQSRFGNIFQLAGDQSTKIRFDNTKLGYRIATSVDGTLTGTGGSCLLFDDPNSASDTSDTMLENAVNWFTQVFSTRLNNPKDGKIIGVQQRIAERDISGHILAHERDDWLHLCLPMEFEPDRRSTTVPLPSTNGKPWTDFRTKAGELLWPEHMDAKAVARLKRALQSEYAVAGQLQQRPAPAEGGIIKRAWFKLWPASKPFPVFEYVLQSYDTAFTDDTVNDKSAGQTWGIFKEEGRWCGLLLDCWAEHLNYNDLKKKVVEDADSMWSDPPKAVDLIVIEDKASGILLRRDLQQAGLPIKPFNPGAHDKEQRMHVVSYLPANGLLYLPESDKEERKGLVRTWVQPFLDEVCMFPNSRFKDQADCFSQAMIILKDMRMLSNKVEIEEDEYESWDREENYNPYAV